MLLIQSDYDIIRKMYSLKMCFKRPFISVLEQP